MSKSFNIDSYAVILPSLNPTEKLCGVVEGLINTGFSNIILVDDGSAPEFQEPFTRLSALPQVTLLRHEVNRGKGAGLKTAFAYLLEQRPDIAGAVTADGDGQHLSHDILACAEASDAHPDTMVLGFRNFDLPHVPPRSRSGNKITNGIFRILCGVVLKDTQTGLRVIRREHFAKMLEIKGERYEYETNMLLEVHSAGIGFTEVEIETVYEDNNSCSHFRPVRDSMRIYKLILAHVFRRLFRFFKYALSSCASAAIDLGVFWLLHFLLVGILGETATLVSTALARAISSFVNFNINKSIVFESKSGYGWAIVRYYILCVAQILVSAGLVWLLGRLFCTSKSYVLTGLKAVVDTALFFVSYRIQHRWVFKVK